LGNKDHVTEADLRNRLRKLEEEQQDFKIHIRKTQEKETERDENACKEYLELEHMREICQGDQKLLQLIEEKQSMLTAIRKRRMEFINDMQQEAKKNIRKTDLDKEEIHYQMQMLQEEETN